MKQRFAAVLVTALLVASAIVPTGHDVAGAQGAVTLRIATLAPANSSIMRVLNAWKQSLTEATTVNGSISATVRTGRGPSEDIKLSTVNGSVRLPMDARHHPGRPMLHMLHMPQLARVEMTT